VSYAAPVPPSLPPLWSPRGPEVPQPSPIGTPSADTSQRPTNWRCWDKRAADPSRADISRLRVVSLSAAGVCTLAVSGEIDHLTAPGLEEVLRDVLDPSQPLSSVVVDLRHVTFLGAVGLRVLAGGHRLAESVGARLQIRCGRIRAVIRPLQVTGLWEVLHVIEREGTDSR
jgi:anti-sigma B factor antagonist